MEKDYASAQKNYQYVYSDRLPGADYATFQKAIITGLNGNDAGKIDEMRLLISDFPKSIYVDDAAFEIGDAYLNAGDYANATKTFQNITTKYAKSAFAKKSLLKLGLISYNLDRNEQAMSLAVTLPMLKRASSSIFRMP